MENLWYAYDVIKFYISPINYIYEKATCKETLKIVSVGTYKVLKTLILNKQIKYKKS